MPLILNIDTALENASICLSENEEVIAFERSEKQRNHASFLQAGIKKMMDQAKVRLQAIDAIALSNGPGSYTGLRIGLSSAKGLCYALNKPLILVNTLEIMAKAAIENVRNSKIHKPGECLFCPMIDARRMEVYTAIYSEKLEIFLQPQALLIDEKSFSEQLLNQNVIFFGSGSAKFENIIKLPQALFLDVKNDVRDIVFFANKYFAGKIYSTLSSSVPFYVKDFFLHK
jgi:tRNA threonylcarbamoyladenosine biosynthesis protein TsaB